MRNIFIQFCILFSFFFWSCESLKEFAFTDPALSKSTNSNPEKELQAFYKSEFNKFFDAYIKESEGAIIYPEKSNLNSGVHLREDNCFAKCVIQTYYETIIENIAIYTGDSLTAPFIDRQSISLVEAGHIWERKPTESYCVPTHKKDCMVWNLNQIEEKVEIFMVVPDTTLTKDFEIKTIERKVVIKEGGYSEWRTVICEEYASNKLFNYVKKNLKSKGYFKIKYENEWDVFMSANLKSSLINYQMDHELPMGYLDYETLYHLGK